MAMRVELVQEAAEDLMTAASFYEEQRPGLARRFVVAKMEAGNPAVSLELLMRALLVLGASRQELAGAIR